MKRMVLTRLEQNATQTLGALTVFDGRDKVFDGWGLEPPWKSNQKRISCIPAGRYKVVPRFSAKFRHHFHVLDVEDRTLILLHVGNFYKQTEGCVLVGSRLAYLNNDGLLDVAASARAMEVLLSVFQDMEYFWLDIIDPV